MQQKYLPSIELSLLLTASTLECRHRIAGGLDIPWSRLDWQKTLRLANFHGLSCWLAEYTKDNDKVPDEVKQKLAGRLRSQLLSLTFIEQQKSTLITKLQQHGIRFAILKGGAIAKPLYQQHWYYRSMVDVDILISPSQLSLAFAQLQALGFRDTNQYPLGSREFEQIALNHKDSTVIEHTLVHNSGYMTLDIHWKLRRNNLLPVDDQKLFDGIVLDSHGVPRLTPDLEFIYLCVNGMNDGWRKLKSLVDILYYAQNIANWTKINDTAKALGLLHIVNASLAICDFFFATGYAPKQLNKKEQLLLNFVINSFATNNEFPVVHSYLDNRNIYRSIKNSFSWWLAISSELISVTTVLKSLLLPNEDDYKGDMAVNSRQFFGYLVKRTLRLIKQYYLVKR